MVYTSGIATSLTEPQSLEQLQDNKLTIVCEKLDLQPDDHLLDIGCGWGTLAAFAHKNYGCKVTGVTLAKKQTQFGNDRIVSNGGDPERAKILCCDYRDIPGGPATYSKIVSLEMAEVRVFVVLSCVDSKLNGAFCCSMLVSVVMTRFYAKFMTSSTTMVSLCSKSLVSVTVGNTKI